MVVRSSAAVEVERLIARLSSASPGERDAAVARLRVIGTRAVGRLAETVASDGGPAVARAEALRALEESQDLRARSAALSAALARDPTVALAAIAVLQRWITRDDGLAVIERLTVLALDGGYPDAVRLSALDALSELPRDIVQPLIAAVASATTPPRQPLDGRHATEDRPDGGVPDDAVAAREWLDERADAPLSLLHTFVTQARERQRLERSARRRQDWQVTRGAAHALLAKRGSRIALYDLRETFDAVTAPLPLDYLTAISVIGDASCLEAMARAWGAVPHETWWRERISDAAAGIVHRTGLSGRSALIRRLRLKFPDFVESVTSRRPRRASQ